ncbi:hypothetical protein B0A52_09692 [Exophiala mesophila]|uniref:4-coumarate-CoA ligase n=1 Tax=Exophiala mesophila TaxID=212818 RepID=A0A438MS23_EXOME|nr:hypothetical protein B0A52_09692 [Exophiala mesophila]
MPDKSKFRIVVPDGDLLTYLLPPEDHGDGDQRLWIDAEDTSRYITRLGTLQWVKSLSVAFQRMGVRVGDVVLMFSPNHIYVPPAYIGTVAHGAVFTAASPASTTREVTMQLQQTKAKAILVHPSLAKTAISAANAAVLPLERLYLFSDRPSKPVAGLEDLWSILGCPSEIENWRAPEVNRDQRQRQACVINFSSGTTGMPKGVCISQANLIANSEQSIYVRSLEKNVDAPDQLSDRWLGFLPLYHAFGQVFSIVLSCRLGIPVYVMKKFRYESFLQHIQNHSITGFTTAPPVLVMLNKRPETASYDLSSLKEIVCGAAPLSKELQTSLSRRLNVRIRQTYGGTELTCSSTGIPGGMDDITGSVGVLYPNMECKLLDKAGHEVGTGIPGEAYMKGPNVCLGYWQNEQATRDAIDRDGFYRTGDILVKDERGMYYVLDRIKEMIKVNGLQVVPAELEAVLLQNHDVADAAVVGVPWSQEERPRAYVVLKPHAKGKISSVNLRDWVAKRVAKHKRLEGGIIFVDAIPKSPTGKIQRNLVRNWSRL